MPSEDERDLRQRDRARKALGRRGEAIVVAHLQANGLEIVDRNVRVGRDELDIVALHRGQYVFVEVRTRSTEVFGLPLASVDREKQRKVRRAALRWLAGQKRKAPARFDAAGVTIAGGRVRLDYVVNAF